MITIKFVLLLIMGTYTSLRDDAWYYSEYVGPYRQPSATGVWAWIRSQFAPRRFRGMRFFPGTTNVPAHYVNDEGGALSVGMTFRTPFRFRIDNESAMDSLAKDLGVSREHQTGDKAFDDSVYLACDDRWLAATLAGKREARSAVLDVLRLGGSIEGDRHVLWLRVTGEVEERKALQWLAALRSTLLPTPVLPGGKLPAAPKREMWIESVLGVGAFAGTLAGVAHLCGESVFVDELDALWRCSAFAAILVVATLAAVSRVLRQSAWSHRLLLELGIMGAVGLPLGTLALMAKLNRAWDRGPVAATPVRVTSVAHGGWFQGSRTTVGFRAEREPASAGILRSLAVPVSDAHDVRIGDWLNVEIGAGFFGLPYYRAVSRVR